MFFQLLLHGDHLDLFISDMFSLSLVACHNASMKTVQIDISSLPSVSELLEGMGEYLEEKYGTTFPSLPQLFRACDDPSPDDIQPSPTVILFHEIEDSLVPGPSATMEPSFSLARAPPTFEATATPSTVGEEALVMEVEANPPSQEPYKTKVKCQFCGKEQAYSNLARHERIHKKACWLKCDQCLYTTPRKDDLERHKQLTHDGYR